MRKILIMQFLIFLIFLSSFVISAAPSNGGFYYSLAEGSCESGPGPNLASIQVGQGFIEGPCNGDGITPSPISNQCCLQVCENYNLQTKQCSLKSGFIRLLEEKVGPLDNYNQNGTPANENNANNILLLNLGYVLAAIVVLGLIIYVAKNKSSKQKTK